MIKKPILTFLLLAIGALGHAISLPEQQSFGHIRLESDADIVSCVVQDEGGMIWFGTNKGLYSYDGHSYRPHFRPLSYHQTHIHCGVADGHLLYLGSDKGLLVYDMVTEQYLPGNPAAGNSVRSLLARDGKLWLGTLGGLYIYDPADGTLADRSGDLSHRTVYALAQDPDGNVFIGTYDGLNFYDAATGVTAPYRFESGHSRNLFVNCLLVDRARGCVWAGLEGGLLNIDPGTGSITSIPQFGESTVKTMCHDGSGNIIIGTDNGLFVFDGTGPARHYLQDTRLPNSLPNNTVWALCRDRDGNIWLGTDYGAAIMPGSGRQGFTPLYTITGSGEGNRLYCLLRDSGGAFWMGGTNGVIRVGPGSRTVWFSPGSATHPLAHNRIRHIFEDSRGTVWLATDGSVNHYDPTSGQFVHYTISDLTGTRNANWAYNLYEDKNGRLWIATCLGGIFVIDRDRLAARPGGNFTAPVNLTPDDGLSGLFVNQLTEDSAGRIWVLIFNGGIDIIDPETSAIERFPVTDHTGGILPNYLFGDSRGTIWAGFSGGVLRIDPVARTARVVETDPYGRSEVTAMGETDGGVWVASGSGVYRIADDLTVSRVPVAGRSYTSMYYDRGETTVYLGSVDGLQVCKPDITDTASGAAPVRFTGVYANGEPLEPQDGEPGIRYAGRVRLGHWQNNLRFEFSDLRYPASDGNLYYYRLAGPDNVWHPAGDAGSVTFTNLAPGKYILYVAGSGGGGVDPASTAALEIRIAPPWYQSRAAKAAYVVIALGILIIAANLVRTRHRLSAMRLEKEWTLEQSRQKMEFFTTVSHELKTPLSLILPLVSRMMHQARSETQKKMLETVYRNAIKLNSLIHQALDLDRLDTAASSLIESRIELCGFAESIFRTFAGNESHSGKTLRLECPSGRGIFLDGDAMKLEAVIGNLLSNAVKYTPDGGTVTLSVDRTGSEAVLKVTDTGIGIPEAEQPYVFQRFYQSSLTKDKKEGTGIGLYIARVYTEMHGGRIEISSSPGNGCRVTVTLPAGEQPAVSGSQSTTAQPDAPVVLIVEDNSSLRKFLEEVLSGEFRCMTATNGKEGYEKAVADPPDLIITDMIMPVSDGMEMCRRLRKIAPLSAVPVIMLTAKDDRQTEMRSVELNIDIFMSKPFEPEILLKRARNLLGKKEDLRRTLALESISRPEPQQAESYGEKFLFDITALIEEHISESELNVGMLCQLSGVSQKQLYRKIKQLTGHSPVDYIRTIRLKKAAMMLAQKKFTVSEVIYTVGFTNHSYFSKCFTAQFGKTPKQYAG